MAGNLCTILATGRAVLGSRMVTEKNSIAPGAFQNVASALYVKKQHKVQGRFQRTNIPSRLPLCCLFVPHRGLAPESFQDMDRLRSLCDDSLIGVGNDSDGD